MVAKAFADPNPFGADIQNLTQEAVQSGVYSRVNTLADLIFRWQSS
jgi:hypothetical protein